jgi:hypothetical protein
MEKGINATNVYMTSLLCLDPESTEHFKIFLESLTALGTLSAVIVAICLPYKQRKDSLKSNKHALKEELIYNLTQLFTGDVDRPLLFESFDIFRIQFADLIKDKENFKTINEIYSFLRFYNRIIESFYLVDPDRYGGLTTEKQAFTQNKILNILKIHAEELNINEIEKLKESREEFIIIYKKEYNKIINEINRIYRNL